MWWMPPNEYKQEAPACFGQPSPWHMEQAISVLRFKDNARRGRVRSRSVKNGAISKLQIAR